MITVGSHPVDCAVEDLGSTNKVEFQILQVLQIVTLYSKYNRALTFEYLCSTNKSHIIDTSGEPQPATNSQKFSILTH